MRLIRPCIRVFVYDCDGEIKTSFGRFGTELDRFACPMGSPSIPSQTRFWSPMPTTSV